MTVERFAPSGTIHFGGNTDDTESPRETGFKVILCLFLVDCRTVACITIPKTLYHVST